MSGVSNWMHVELFTVDQAAALWAGYDPASLWTSDTMKPSEVVAAKQLLASCIVGGELRADSSKNSFSRIGDYSKSLVARQDLESIARKRRLFPTFLFDTLSPIEEESTDSLKSHNRRLPRAALHSQPLPEADVVQAAIPEVPTANRGGRPIEYDWDNFVLEIIRRANLPDGLPDKQADLVREMLAWFVATHGREPAESAVKRRVSKIYGYLSTAKNHPSEVSGLSG